MEFLVFVSFGLVGSLFCFVTFLALFSMVFIPKTPSLSDIDHSTHVDADGWEYADVKGVYRYVNGPNKGQKF